jgi:lysophospholipase L1-like esterase
VESLISANSDKVLPNEPAALIVIALGTNDSAKPNSGAPTIEAGYTQLLDLIRQHSAKIVLAGIPAFDMKGGLAASYFDQGTGDSIDAIIRKIAAANNLDFI